MRVAYLGPAGTFTEDALREAAGAAPVELLPVLTVYDAILGVEAGEADLAFVPFENSIEGSVRTTLDTLAFDATAVTIAGEHDYLVRHRLIARRPYALEEIRAVISHPQAIAQCARFVREELPAAEVMAATSTAEAVRQLKGTEAPWAALGTTSAATIYDCVVLREGIEDAAENVTRFVWISPRHGPPVSDDDVPWRTSLVFSELGEDRPGALVDALLELSRRQVNLTRIESRPQRRGLGRYLFFIDIEGGSEDPKVAAAIEALREVAERVRILGSYPVGVAPLPAQ